MIIERHEIDEKLPLYMEYSGLDVEENELIVYKDGNIIAKFPALALLRLFGYDCKDGIIELDDNIDNTLYIALDMETMQSLIFDNIHHNNMHIHKYYIRLVMDNITVAEFEIETICNIFGIDCQDNFMFTKDGLVETVPV